MLAITGILGPIGLQELIIILIVLLLLFGAKKLPELARGLGQSIKEFKKATTDTDNENVPKIEKKIKKE